MYTVVVAGFTVCVDPLKLPGCHAYDTPPVAVIPLVNPKQIGEALFEAVTVGNTFTLTVAVDVLVQPLPSVPVTV